MKLWGLVHSIFVTTPLTVTGWFESYSAPNEWCAKAGDPRITKAAATLTARTRLRSDTGKALLIIGAPGARMARHLGMRAQRTRHRRQGPAARTRRGDTRRRVAGFAPAFERAEEVGLIRPDAAAAVADARHEEQAHPVVLLASQLRGHGVVVVDRVLRRRPRVGPAVIQQELAAARLELRQ